MKKALTVLIATAGLATLAFSNANAASPSYVFCPSTHMGLKLFDVSGEQPTSENVATIPGRFLICSYGNKAVNVIITYLNAAPIKMDDWKITPQQAGLSFADCTPVDGNTYNCPFYMTH